MKLREAVLSDIEAMHTVRMAVKENILSNPDLISYADYQEMISMKGKGWVAEVEGQVVGFAMVDLQANNVWALFLHPDFEKQGIGHRLHSLMLTWYFAQTNTTLWLSTTPATRAEIFYKQAGWVAVGTYGKDEIKFEMTREQWQSSKM